jgi:hypothetical protein
MLIEFEVTWDATQTDATREEIEAAILEHFQLENDGLTFDVEIGGGEEITAEVGTHWSPS